MGIERLHFGKERAGRFEAHGREAICDGRDDGIDPVLQVIRGLVEHIAPKALTGFDRFPHQPKDAFGHLFVADDAMRRAFEALGRMVRDTGKHGVPCLQYPARIGAREEEFVQAERRLARAGTRFEMVGGRGLEK